MNINAVPALHLLIPDEYRKTDLSCSSAASLRLRVALLETELASGRTIRVTKGEKPPEHTSILLVCKPMFGNDPDDKRRKLWLSTIIESRNRGIPVIIDYTDHHLAIDTPNKAFYTGALQECNAVVTSSAGLSSALKSHLPHANISTIEDSIDVGMIPPKGGMISREPTYLWFGHGTNVGFLVDYLMPERPDLAGGRLLILTDRLGALNFKNRSAEMRTRVHCELFQWSIENTMAAARLSDWVLIPSNPTHPAKQYVSNNRLLTSLALGLPVAATRLPSYDPYKEFFRDIDGDWSPAEWRDPGSEMEKVLTAQRLVIPRFSPKALARKWELLVSQYV